jgi:hypothetical protein
MVTLIPRWNSYHSKLSGDYFQSGLALLFTYNRKNDLKYKFGLYYNSEFSGPFFMPLLGIDWKINDKNNLFGVLPGSLVYEHKVNNKIYWGASYRAVTNSFNAGRLDNASSPSFIRIEENQVALFTDIYLFRQFVFNVEMGHSVLRQISLGLIGSRKNYYYEEYVNDNLVFKASVAYRVRFR